MLDKRLPRDRGFRSEGDPDSGRAPHAAG